MGFQSIVLKQSRGTDESRQDSPDRHHHGDHGGVVAFFGHFAEMSVAMMAGMMIGMAFFGFLLGRPALRTPEIGAATMTASMTIPMVAWMLVRGHSWRVSAEMAAAMVLPVVALFPLYWLGLISSGTLVGLEHGLMMPAMIVAMLYRRHDYGL